jgi:UDP-3-O-[3-hydroxymyristoyl] glucosamine N-acyltransferase
VVQTSARDIAKFVNGVLIGKPDILVKRVTSLEDAGKSDLSFYTGSESPRTKADVVIVKQRFNIPATQIVVNNPRLAVIRVLKNMYNYVEEPRIDPTALINHSVVKIGKRVEIKAYSIVGYTGFSFERNEQGRLELFPQLGGTVLEDDVEIGPLCVIDRGTFTDTIIKRGTKIDCRVHIGHNSIIGEDCGIAAETVMAGHVTVGDRAFVGMNVSIREGTKIGKDAFVGAGAVVVANVPAGITVVGNPAKPLRSKMTRMSTKPSKK